MSLSRVAATLFLCPLGLTLSMADPCVAQGCPDVHAPLAMVTAEGQIVRSLHADGFQVRLGGKPAQLALQPDFRPKRLLLVFELTKRVAEPGRRILQNMSTAILHSAREQDEFGFIAYGDMELVAAFSKKPLPLVTQIESLAQTPAGKASARTYDALAQALDLFSTPRFGDTVLLFTAGMDQGSKTQLKDVAKALAQRGIRLFVFATATSSRATGFYMVGSGNEMPFDPDTEDLHDLARDSGGFLMLENTKLRWGTYELGNARLEQLKRDGVALYQLISQPYLLTVSPQAGKHRDKLEVTLDKMIEKQLPRVRILYPRKLASCP